VKIVFLGDVFDINRTTYWLGVDESERPWGDLEDKYQQFETWTGSLKEVLSTRVIFCSTKKERRKPGLAWSNKNRKAKLSWKSEKFFLKE
jgi:hypothetical protein